LSKNDASLPALVRQADNLPFSHFDRGGRCPYHARAMGNLLHLRRTPIDFAENSQVIEIIGKVGNFKQLAAVVESDLAALDADNIPTGWRDRQVSGELRFGFADAQGRIPALAGELNATIDAVCQRCLEPLELPLTSDLRLVFLGEQGLEIDGEAYEVWELDGDELSIVELVEEALLMTIPFVAMHDGDTGCSAKAEAGGTEQKMTLPFANLKTQMQQED
jgi:uncharacterized protein